MAGIQLVGVSGKAPAAPAPTTTASGAPAGRINAANLGQKIQSWNPTPQQLAATQAKAQAAAEMAAATAKTKQAGATGFWGRIQAAGKSAVVAVGRPVVDIATGQGGKAVHDSSQLTSDISGGTVNQFAAGVKQVPKGIAADIAAGSKDPATRAAGIQAQKEAQQAAFKTNDSGKIAKKIVGSTVGTMAMFVGGGEGAAAAKGAETAAAKIAAAKLAAKAAEETAAKTGAKVASKDIITKSADLIKANSKLGAAGAAGNAGSTVVNNPNASVKDVALSGAQGYAGGLALGVAGKVFADGSKTAIARLKNGDTLAPTPEEASAKFKTEGSSTAPKLDDTNMDQAAASAHTKIGVEDASNAPQKVGVSTPVRPGVKEISTTDQINVRTPQKMSDEDFHSNFQKLSDQYDKETKQLQAASKVLPQKTVQIKQDALETKFQNKINDLQDSYHNPELSAPKAPKTISKSTTPAGKTTGGATGGLTKAETKLSDLGGKRPENAAQSELETAHNAGDAAGEAKAAAKLSDPALAAKSTVSKGAGQIFMDAQKAGKPITMDEARARAGGTPAGERTAGSAKNLETRAVEKKLLDRSDDLPEYHTMNMKEQAERSTDLIAKDPERAKRVAAGHEGAPAGLHPMSVLKALEHKASKEGDGATLRELSMSPLHVKGSQSAQTLRVLAEKDPDSPLGAMKSVSDKRAAAFEKKSGKTADKAISEEAGKYKTAVKAATKTPSKDEWKVFLESIKC